MSGSWWWSKKPVDSYSKIVSGADGDLVITSGNTVNLASGSIKQYNSIDIQAGGTLSIDGTGFQKTEIGCRNSFVLNGQIIVRCHLSGGSESINGSTSIGGYSYSKVLNQSNGGAGGAGGDITWNGFQPGGSGGAASNTGYGGGGGSGGCKNVFSPGAAGGSGGTANGSGASPGSGSGFFGGAGNSTLGTGAAGSLTSGGAGGGSGGAGPVYEDGFSRSGGGGGGGYKGRHGSYLFLFLEGSISGTGTIYANGLNGYSGGNGFSTTGGYSGGGGGGGGGGAGGSGGIIDVWKRTAQVFTPSMNVSAGSGGAPGSGGASYNAGPPFTTNGVSGNIGAPGSGGAANINNIVGG